MQALVRMSHTYIKNVEKDACAVYYTGSKGMSYPSSGIPPPSDEDIDCWMKRHSVDCTQMPVIVSNDLSIHI